MAKPIDRSCRYFERRGYLVGKVERVTRYVSHDLWGMFDAIADKEGELIVGIQATNKGNFAAHVDKILAAEHYGRVKDLGWRIAMMGWDPKVRGEDGLRLEWL